MNNIFKIPTYKPDENGKLVFLKEVEFSITYVKTGKPQILRIAVDGFLTKEVVNLYNEHQGYKKAILQAISDYVNNNINPLYGAKKSVTKDYLKQIKSMGVYNAFTRLLTINKEYNRDTLTKFNLINLK